MTDIRLPDELVSRVNRRIVGTEFDDSDEWVAFVVREMLVQLEEEDEKQPPEQESSEDIEARLRSLGYLDE